MKRFFLLTLFLLTACGTTMPTVETVKVNAQKFFNLWLDTYWMPAKPGQNADR